tara:strand:+ start:17193 stop:17726 length:534 start_codon:yes stop_codon:yes gene_type:complete
MKSRIFIFLILIGLTSCSEQEARRPVTASKTYTLAATTESLKKINNLEEAKIENYILKDSLNNYIRSSNGFWYQYITKIDEDTTKPKKGDVVELQYDFVDLNDQIIYSKDQIGTKKYKVDKEDFIPALQMAIKMMKVGETVKFIIPSYNAFGVVGDQNKIGINQSIISRVTLININK